MSNFLEALCSCNLEKVKSFIKNGSGCGVNSEIPNTEGCTPLHIAVGTEYYDGKEALLSYLFRIGADPNSRSYDHLTPVHIAAMWNNCFELEKLLQNGGNPWLTDQDNKNAFDMAADHKSFEAFQLLNKYLSEEKLNFCAENQTINNNSANSQNCMESNWANNISENFQPLLFSSTDDDSTINNSDVGKKIKSNNKLPEFSESCESLDKFLRLIKENASRHLNQAFLMSSTKSEKSDTTIVTCKNETEIVIDSDLKTGIVLVETRSNAPSQSSSLSKNRDLSISSVGSDWKMYRTCKTDSLSSSYCSVHSAATVVIPDSIRKLSNIKLYQELKRLGDDPGPVLECTREVYLQRLTKLKFGCLSSCNLPKPKYCKEVYFMLQSKLDMKKLQKSHQALLCDFDNSALTKNLRGGNQRCSFIYFLLDPRVTRNLPIRANQLTYEDNFTTFIDSLFYIGKGTRSRPYSHLFEAAKAIRDCSIHRSEKIQHILGIWNSDNGVISLHCFNNCIPTEAYTHEACVIEAVGLPNLTNKKNGNFYGIASRWSMSKKRQIGVLLLSKALEIFLQEGERPIRPKDVK